MATNNFKAFAVASGANVTSQTDYEALAALATGFTAGVAKSSQVNKALRQATFIASVLAQFISDKAAVDVLDNGNATTLMTNLIAALKANSVNDFFQRSNNLSEIATTGTAVQIAAAKLATRTNIGLESVIGQLANGGTFASCTSNGYYLVAITDPTGISDMPKFNGTYALGSGFLFVSKSETSICQTYITANGGTCSRFKLGSGGFSDWDFKFSSVYKPTLDSLGLSGGSLLPVGTPVPWSLSTPPTGWLVCKGSAFSTTANPKLAIAYPSGVLPDLRGEFIRGWDNARGVDSGRTLLSAQTDAIRDIVGGNIRTVISSNASTAPTGAFDAISRVGSTGTGSSSVSLMDIDFKASRVVPTATDNRPRNIAFNYIVKAE